MRKPATLGRISGTCKSPNCFGARTYPGESSLNHGVVRGLKDRDGWSKRWHQTMASAQVQSPEQLEPGADLTSDIDQLRASDVSNEWLITARADAEQGLESFLQARGVSYHLSMSSPLTAEKARVQGCPFHSPSASSRCARYTKRPKPRPSESERTRKTSPTPGRRHYKRLVPGSGGIVTLCRSLRTSPPSS